MANSRTIAQVLGEISVLYPLMFSPTPEMTQVWKLYLRDLDDELLINALHHYVATAKDNYPPSVPGLRKAASDLKRMAANVPSTAEAWGAIMESFQRTSFDQPALIKNPIVQEAIHCMGGIAEIGRSENSMAERAHFMKIYEGIVGKLTEEDRELPEVKKYIEKIKQPPLLELTGDGGRGTDPTSRKRFGTSPALPKCTAHGPVLEPGLSPTEDRDYLVPCPVLEPGLSLEPGLPSKRNLRMNTLTKNEALCRNRDYPEKRKFPRFRIDQGPKRVMIMYPDCSELDWMSLTEFKKWQKSDFPEGTEIWIDGIRVM